MLICIATCLLAHTPCTPHTLTPSHTLHTSHTLPPHTPYHITPSHTLHTTHLTTSHTSHPIHPHPHTLIHPPSYTPHPHILHTLHPHMLHTHISHPHAPSHHHTSYLTLTPGPCREYTVGSNMMNCRTEEQWRMVGGKQCALRGNTSTTLTQTLVCGLAPC